MDVVYPVKDGANEELRYSLRSLANISHDQVWIFGGGPNWIRRVQHVRAPRLATKYLTTTSHLKAACEHGDISDPFMLWNDDMYAVAPTVPGHYDRGPVRDILADYQHRHPGSAYTRGMAATLAHLQANGYPDPLSYELHIPLVVHHAAMLKAIELGADHAVWHKRTAYGALVALPSTTIGDVKVYNQQQPIPDGPWLSSCDKTFPHLRRHLHRLFPKPGRHER